MNKESTISQLSYGGSTTSVFLGLNVDEWGILGVVVGILLGLATFGINIWFKRKHLNLVQENRDG